MICCWGLQNRFQRKQSNLNTQYISELINPNVEGTVIISRPQRHTFGEATQIKIGNKAINHSKIEKSNLTYLDLNGAFDSKTKQSESCSVEALEGAAKKPGLQDVIRGSKHVANTQRPDAIGAHGQLRNNAHRKKKRTHMERKK
ncbi:hypothetical protein LXL04_007952 [Taraxacum kok-saghyz]